MTDRDRPPTLNDLDRRLKAARERRDRTRRDDRPAGTASASGLSFALRIGVELVSAVIVGAGIGWLLDRWLGTGPWLMVVFLFLGMGAGITNVYRAASGLGSAVGYRSDGDQRDDDDADADRK